MTGVVRATHHRLQVNTRGRGLHDVGAAVADAIDSCKIRDGIATVWCRHTSCSLLVGENADPTVVGDLERFFSRLVRDGDPLFAHDAEGPDDMPAHVRTALTATSIVIPLIEGRLDLGTWQGIFLWEHRLRPHTRQLTIALVGA